MYELTVDQIVPSTQNWLLNHEPALAYLKRRKINGKQLLLYGIGCSGPGFKIKGTDLVVYSNLFTTVLMDEYGVKKGILTRKLSEDGAESVYFQVIWNEEAKHIVYGLQQCVEEVYRTGIVLLAEGCFDTLAIQPIITTSCGILTSTLSSVQVSILKRYAKRILFVPDSDKTGDRESEKFKNRHSRDFQVSIIKLPDGIKDPSKWRQEDPVSFLEFWEEVRDTYF